MAKEVLGDSLPEDWRKFHAENVARLDPVLRGRAVAFLVDGFAKMPEGERERVTKEARESVKGDWFAQYHFGVGMQIRNMLRQAGFGEREFNIDNLDDYYVGLIEQALGVHADCASC